VFEKGCDASLDLPTLGFGEVVADVGERLKLDGFLSGNRGPLGFSLDGGVGAERQHEVPLKLTLIQVTTPTQHDRGSSSGMLEPELLLVLGLHDREVVDPRSVGSDQRLTHAAIPGSVSESRRAGALHHLGDDL
jgi:hypothetical protein